VSTQLQELRSLAAESGFSAGVVVLPPREQVVGLYPDSEYQGRIRRMADQLGLFVIDPLPLLTAGSKAKSSLFIPYDRNHPSAAGHRVIAETIVEYFDQHQSVVHGSGRPVRSARAQ
jgi:hypothetical protein